MSRHEGVSCDSCLANDFGGKRFKCLICYDYDLCENCHYRQASTERHLSSHAMQCILTRKDFDLYYGGETISPESPPSFVCPFCCKLGFTEVSLQEHITKEHQDQHTEVVCPVCSSQPSGEPNLVTDDLAHHLSTQHRTSPDTDGPIGGRHIRRMLYPGRGMRSRNHRSMHFSSSPIATSAITSSSVVASNNNAPSPARELMDPIAELLSQLSGVRRRTQQNGSTTSQLHELHSQLQQERQRAAEIRNQKQSECNMSMRKRKLQCPAASRHAGNKCKSDLVTSPAQVADPNELYRSVFITIIDHPRLAASVGAEHSNVLRIPEIPRSDEANKPPVNSTSVRAGQPSNAIPLPPPMPDSSLNAAGILAELITLRGCQVSSSEQIKDKLKNRDKITGCEIREHSTSTAVLEKFPNKPQSSNTTSQSANVHPSGGVIVASRGTTNKKPPASPHTDQEDDSRYLLAKLDDINLSDDEQQRRHQEDIDRSHFAQELILSILASDCTHSTTGSENDDQLKPALENAVAIDCPPSPSTLNHNSDDPSSSRDLQFNVSSEIASTQNSSQPSFSSRIIENSLSRSNDGTGISLPDDTTSSPVDVSLSVTDQDQVGDRSGDSAAMSSRSAPALGPGAGEQCTLPETAAHWRYHGSINEDEKDSDDEKPPLPILQDQRHGLRFQNHVFPSGSVRVTGGLSSPAPIADYGRQDVATGSPNKNVR